MLINPSQDTLEQLTETETIILVGWVDKGDSEFITMRGLRIPLFGSAICYNASEVDEVGTATLYRTPIAAGDRVRILLTRVVSESASPKISDVHATLQAFSKKRLAEYKNARQAIGARMAELEKLTAQNDHAQALALIEEIQQAGFLTEAEYEQINDAACTILEEEARNPNSDRRPTATSPDQQQALIDQSRRLILKYPAESSPPKDILTHLYRCGINQDQLCELVKSALEQAVGRMPSNDYAGFVVSCLSGVNRFNESIELYLWLIESLTAQDATNESLAGLVIDDLSTAIEDNNLSYPLTAANMKFLREIHERVKTAVIYSAERFASACFLMFTTDSTSL